MNIQCEYFYVIKVKTSNGISLGLEENNYVALINV